MKIKLIHNKYFALLLGTVGFLLILYKVATSGGSQFSPGELCPNDGLRAWQLLPYNGLEEGHPLRKRLLQERTQSSENEDMDLNGLFDTDSESIKAPEKVTTKIEIKEVFVPKPCQTDLSSPQRFVLNCLTNDVVGKISPDLDIEPFDENQGAVYTHTESSLERRRAFSRVYNTGAWGKGWDPEHRDAPSSGRGATLSWTQELSATLHVVINQVKRTLGVDRVRLLDVPCGDMAWMGRFLVTRDDVDYTGIDIVPDLIQQHRKTYNQFPWKFVEADILETPLNQTYHIILCRMLLQHLYFHDIFKLLGKFSKSQSSFLLTTTFVGNQENQDLVVDEDNPGRVRQINLEIPPFSLIPPRCVQRDGPRLDFEGWKHFVGLWKLPLTTVRNCSTIHKMDFPGYPKVKLFSCSHWMS